MKPVIQLIDLYKEFDGVAAVSDLTLEIDKGQIVSLLGPSGCGKTTTLRMMAGFEYPTRGRILLHGDDIINRPARERNMGMVFQNYALFPHMTVAENIGFGLKMRREPKPAIAAKVKQYLELVKLEGFEARKPSQLSGGQQQRVALARALITEPSVLLMDEPFGALDKKLRETMQLEVRNILKTVGITAVFVTHDQEEALVLSDRVAVMNRGRIEQVAPPKDIYEKPATLFVANFIGVSNSFVGEVEFLDGQAYLRVNGGLCLRVDGVDENRLNGGRKGAFTVRPEKVKPAESAGAQCNTVRGRVENLKYLGTVTQYYIDVGSEKPLIMDCQNAGEENPWRVGDECAVYIDPAHLNVVHHTDGNPER